MEPKRNSAGGHTPLSSAVLFVSPSVEDARTLAPILEAMGLPFSHVTQLALAKDLLETGVFGAVLTEATLPDGTWRDMVGVTAQIKRKVTVVVTDLLADARFWVEALESGAYDLLPKPFSREEVQWVMANAVARSGLLPSGAAAA
ncbi:MAG: hypothetical protein IT159_12915 [Bryobacterales bacterium]|jgi:DNA-binding NtrC family response regulator|nr:hypothetical protein [Bryobacterales bacterium]